MTLIETIGLRVGERLQGIDLAVRAGELVGVIGPNGAGKSTLLAALAGLERCRGDVWLDGLPLDARPVRERARLMGYLPQAGQSAWALPVRDVVAMGRLPWGDKNDQAIQAALAATGATDLAGRRIDRLSGGEQARVWLARVLAGQPRVLLADEPVAALDLYYQRAVMQALRGFADSGNAALVAIHDLSLAARCCDRLVLLGQGRIHAQGKPGEVLTADLLEALYGLPVHVDLAANPPQVAYR